MEWHAYRRRSITVFRRPNLTRIASYIHLITYQTVEIPPLPRGSTWSYTFVIDKGHLLCIALRLGGSTHAAYLGAGGRCPYRIRGEWVSI